MLRTKGQPAADNNAQREPVPIDKDSLFLIAEPIPPGKKIRWANPWITKHGEPGSSDRVASSAPHYILAGFHRNGV